MGGNHRCRHRGDCARNELVSHRYSILVLALTDVVMAAVLVILTIPNFHPLSSHAAIYLMAFLLLWAGFDEFKKGKQHAMVQGKGWKAERVQVESWLDVLQGNPKNDRVIEIKERTFRWGDITYRFLNTGDCWVMAIFRTRKEHELPIDYTVGQPDAVTLMEGPGGILSAKVDGRVIPKRRAVAA